LEVPVEVLGNLERQRILRGIVDAQSWDGSRSGSEENKGEDGLHGSRQEAASSLHAIGECRECAVPRDYHVIDASGAFGCQRAIILNTHNVREFVSSLDS
jgi:hypothetical protein